MIRETRETGNIVRFAVFFEAGIFLLAWILGWLIGIPPLRQMHATWTGLGAGLLATGPLLLGMWWCSVSQFRPLQALMRQMEESLVPLFHGASSRTLLLISVLAGLGEEGLFRGVFQTGLTEWLGMPVALLTTSALFGLAHLITPTYAVLAGLIGIYLGALAVVTDSLFAPVVAHALYDYAALTYLVSARQTRHGA